MWSWLRLSHRTVHMDCKMSFKVHIFGTHFDKFKKNREAYSEVQEDFWSLHILSKNSTKKVWWGLLWDNNLQYSRKFRKSTYFLTILSDFDWFLVFTVQIYCSSIFAHLLLLCLHAWKETSVCLCPCGYYKSSFW